ncbi:hypothetical protein EJB05_03127 [Eragrostis curvula]|uniref:GOLD domain-containing protein n=1 Tax=Eragrostis curvula TaxID=38414 RepID=A0A5J9WVB2_9POAL|nr:hypothetical protein EJB05_03126 [Eragrostis curvula]TVU51686.1 hypothetical protein EJB05_03127 [Eragrostis curvula]
MARLYHVTLLVSLLLLAGGLTSAAVAAADQAESVDAPGGKKVTMSMRYAAGDPEKKVRISVQYVDEDAGSDNQFSMDVHDDEPLGIAVQYLLSNLKALRDEAKASRAEL